MTMSTIHKESKAYSKNTSYKYYSDTQHGLHYLSHHPIIIAQGHASENGRSPKRTACSTPSQPLRLPKYLRDWLKESCAPSQQSASPLQIMVPSSIFVHLPVFQQPSLPMPTSMPPLTELKVFWLCPYAYCW